MSDESTRPSAGRRYLVAGLKLTVSAVLLGFLFSRIDSAQFWEGARRASLPWLAAGLGALAVNIGAATWRWKLLLDAQGVHLPARRLFGSFLIANFFNNFLPSNVGGDVIRIRDTAGPAGSKTLATTIVLVDRGLGLMGLVLIAATGATIVTGLHGAGSSPVWPSWLWGVFLAGAVASAPAVLVPEGVGRLLRPLTVMHPEWVGTRIETFTSALNRFRERPAALVGCFGGAIVVQGLIVVFYVLVAHALHLRVAAAELAVIVPLSLVVQMLPVSVNGLGLREATFSFYFTRLGLPIESAVLLSLVGAGLGLLFSLTGAAAYVSRGH